MSEYVNYDGLKRYDELIKNVISVKTWIGSCSTAAGTAAKVISVESGFKLLKGVRIGVKFTNSNTASNVTLNVNSAGAKSIYYNNAVYTGTSNMICGYANRYVFYVYDGTNWVWDGYSNHDVPTVNNATLTIQKNGTTVKTFTANASSNVTANITVPTKVSELTNDSGYTTNTGTVTSVKVGTTSYSPSSGVVSLPAYPTSLPANGGTASNVSGTVAIGNGGTGATTAAGARTNLGLGTLATKSSLTASDIPSITKSKISDFPSSIALLENTDSTVYSPNFDPEAHTVHVTAQTLSTAQKTQARTNIGAADASTVVNSSVIRNIVTISQADYNALSSKDNTTLYIII